MVHPTPNRLVRHRHSAFRQQILDVTQAEGEPEVKPYRLLNDLGRETIPAVADLVHPGGATRPQRTPQARSAVTTPRKSSGETPLTARGSASAGGAPSSIAVRKGEAVSGAFGPVAGPFAFGPRSATCTVRSASYIPPPPTSMKEIGFGAP